MHGERAQHVCSESEPSATDQARCSLRGPSRPPRAPHKPTPPCQRVPVRRRGRAGGPRRPLSVHVHARRASPATRQSHAALSGAGPGRLHSRSTCTRYSTRTDRLDHTDIGAAARSFHAG